MVSSRPASAPGSRPGRERQRHEHPRQARRPSEDNLPRPRFAPGVESAETLGGTEPARFDEGALPAHVPALPTEFLEDDSPPRPLDFRDPPQTPRDPDGEDVHVEDLGASPTGMLTALCGVKFRAAGRVYEYDAGELSLAVGDRVVVETERGSQLGLVAVAPLRVSHTPSGDQTLRRIVRRAGPEDLTSDPRSAARIREITDATRALLRRNALQVKLSRIEIPGPGRVVVYLGAEERLDVSGLLRDLSSQLHARVEVRQLGPREEAKAVGGIGDCGLTLCCSTFLPRFEPISIKMAKDQGLALNPQKLAGQCGRLKCCLVYEHAAYVEARKGLPKVGKRVITPAGDGKVSDLDILRQRVRVSFEDGSSQTFAAHEVQAATPASPPAAGSSTPPPPAEAAE